MSFVSLCSHGPVTTPPLTPVKKVLTPTKQNTNVAQYSLQRVATEVFRSPQALGPSPFGSPQSNRGLKENLYQQLKACGVDSPAMFYTLAKKQQAEIKSNDGAFVLKKIKASSNHQTIYISEKSIYITDRFLGAGAQSSVISTYKVTTTHDSPVKKKVLKESALSFLREKKLLEKLTPGAPERQFLDLIEDEGRLMRGKDAVIRGHIGTVYVSVYTPSEGDLKQFDYSSVPDPLTFIISKVKDFARGIAFMHQHGIIHRDIKGANLLVNRSEPGKVTDFGLAMETPAEGVLHETYYSHAYADPSMWKGLECKIAGRYGHQSEKTDVFSMGQTLAQDVLVPLFAYTGERYGIETAEAIKSISPVHIMFPCPDYASPEDLEAKHPGRVIYKMSNGEQKAYLFPKRAHLLETSFKLIELFQEAVMPVQEIQKWKGLVHLTHELLAKNQSKRPSMDEVVNALDRLSPELPVIKEEKEIQKSATPKKPRRLQFDSDSDLGVKGEKRKEFTYAESDDQQGREKRPRV